MHLIAYGDQKLFERSQDRWEYCQLFNLILHFSFVKDAAGWCRILHQPFWQSKLQIRWEDFKLQIWGWGEFGIREKSRFYSFSSQTLRPIEAGEELTVKYGNCTKTAASDAGYFPFLSFSFYHMAVTHLIIVCFSNADSLSGVGIARWLSFLFLSLFEDKLSYFPCSRLNKNSEADDEVASTLNTVGFAKSAQGR